MVNCNGDTALNGAERDANLNDFVIRLEPQSRTVLDCGRLFDNHRIIQPLMVWDHRKTGHARLPCIRSHNLVTPFPGALQRLARE